MRRRCVMFVLLGWVMGGLMLAAQTSATNFYQQVALAQQAAERNDPKQALQHYQQARVLAEAQNDETLIRVALFGIARMQMWLEHLPQAQALYRQLLMTPLNEQDRALAQSKLMEVEQMMALERKRQGQDGYTNFHEQVDDAQQAAKRNDPKQALQHYQQARILAEIQNNETLIRVALFGMARMQVWLGSLTQAQTLYRQLLTMSLDDQDRALAQAKLVEIDQLKALERKRQKQAKEQRAYTAFHEQVTLAQQAAERNDPKKALQYYQQARVLAETKNNETLIRVALFGIGRLQIWLNKFNQAKQTYQRVLTMTLSDEDRALAQSKLVEIDHLVILVRKRQEEERRQEILSRVKTALYNEQLVLGFEILQEYPDKTSYPYLMTVGLAYAFSASPRHALQYYQRA
ncbi:MAG: hypothetical protein GKR77_07535, partial [Legionellales bacterium]|nr:hypothetical protein [Legionellales bacterium]